MRNDIKSGIRLQIVLGSLEGDWTWWPALGKGQDAELAEWEEEDNGGSNVWEDERVALEAIFADDASCVHNPFINIIMCMDHDYGWNKK